MVHSLIVPMAAHVLLTGALYVLRTAARAPAVWGIGQQADGSNPWGRLEPRISANLSDNIRLRGMVFTLNFLAAAGLWVLAVMTAAA